MMTNSNGETTERKHMQRSDQHESIQVESRLRPGLRTLIPWGWDWCWFFAECEHHEADLQALGSHLGKGQLPFLEDEQRWLSAPEMVVNDEARCLCRREVLLESQHHRRTSTRGVSAKVSHRRYFDQMLKSLIEILTEDASSEDT